MRYGVCYYPEQWPKARWPIDAALMREAGVNVVRIAEFAWSKMEPRPGEFDWSWLDEIIGVLAAHGIQTVLGTPTATPPKWLMDRHPDLYMRDEKGHARGFGNRRHYCYNHAEYRRLSADIVERMAKRYGGHAHVTAWQIDNEFGCTDTIRCYCDNCRAAFQRWLKNKYGDIGTLNEAWGTVFWSHIYNEWEEIGLPAYTVFPMHNPGLHLDYMRFASDSVAEYQQVQVDVLRRESPDKPITHNFMGYFAEVDAYKLAGQLDFASWDNYPNLHFDEKADPLNPAVQHDMTWGLKRQPFWVMEQQSGSPGGNFIFAMPKPGELRRWTYQAVAHGADAILYFRWRTCLFGAEQYWHGLLPHDGIPGRRFEEAKRTGEELQRLSGRWLGAGAVAEVAVLRSYDNEWAMDIQPQSFGHRYMAHLKTYCRYFYERHIPVDIVAPDAPLGKYRLVVVPHDMLTDPAAAEALYAYASAGGTVVLDFRAGIKRPDNRMEERTIPGAYRDLLGLRVADYGSLRQADARAVTLEQGERAPEGFAGRVWYDILELEGAEAIAWYGEDFFAGTPAATRHAYGSGTAYYFATEPTQVLMAALMDRICAHAGVKPIHGISAPAGVEIARRKNGDKEYVFVLNHNEQPAALALAEPLDELIAGVKQAGEVWLEANGVLVFERAVR
ncbi:beta-galactosidase [Cohnella sp. OV330]|uniref:beta-galactosidase n=1 Tax=Cohnella sp. OV330 TaxID=1855288 RepID=UPI0008E728CC|nr:beta-galactosidase [Cohnella sp. OV330]SFB27326.1 beta-galactosidase [Cohnella sp. OV330]